MKSSTLPQQQSGNSAQQN